MLERELRAFLGLRHPAHGFVRVCCDDCGLDRVVAFCCNGSLLSLLRRRMADTAVQRVDRVLPAVPIRQWVLPPPWQLRYRLVYDASLV